MRSFNGRQSIPLSAVRAVRAVRAVHVDPIGSVVRAVHVDPTGSVVHAVHVDPKGSVVHVDPKRRGPLFRPKLFLYAK